MHQRELAEKREEVQQDL
jgi:hypothetical protein